jgi:hypothetical protein
MKNTYKSFSWSIVDKNVAYKVVDKTLIKDKETGVPLDIVYFFANTELDNGQELQSITFYINNKVQNITFKRKKDGRHKIVLKDPENILKLGELLIGNDEVWFERDLAHDNVFHVYTRCSNINTTIYPDQTVIKETSAKYSVNQRIGQQYFRKNVIDECLGRCVVTKLKEQDPSILIASHIKPWLDSSYIEKVDGANGLLLSPHIDKLFDKGLITFDDSKNIITSSLLNDDVLKLWKIDINKSFQLTKRQQLYMEYHQNQVFKV